MEDGDVSHVRTCVAGQVQHVQHDPEGAVHAHGDAVELFRTDAIHLEEVVESLGEGEEEDDVEDQEVEHVLEHALYDGDEVAQSRKELDKEEQRPDVEDVGEHVHLGQDGVVSGYLRRVERQHRRRQQEVTHPVETRAHYEVPGAEHVVQAAVTCFVF